MSDIDITLHPSFASISFSNFNERFSSVGTEDYGLWQYNSTFNNISVTEYIVTVRVFLNVGHSEKIGDVL